MSSSRLLSSSFLRNAQSVRTELFNYHLPESRIATHPLPERSSSKLLVVPHGKVPAHRQFSELPSLLPSESLVVLNATKVIPSRIPAVKSTGGRAEILLLEPLQEGPPKSLQSHASGQLWKAFLGGRRIRVGEVLSACNGDLKAEVVSREKQSAVLRLESHDASPMSTLLTAVGKPPLPPYIKREAEASDVNDYQTVYAHEPGSVAAPTAGLHFTDNVMRNLSSRGIRFREVILHVGAGTFKPVESNDVGGHDMHEETIAIDDSVVSDLIAHSASGAPLIAVVS